ncbi:restriction endonuclease subunit S [Empedobacter falsenii]|uniref:Restriction endonuclease subunit S n=1 Tax=Empedobacter falsenii TaxID=343874 RepID=A0ABY8VA45_9FLAO|nr:restriction endonuclease subunit S [Empedobacter falsenii]WIH98222.1 restriction endonuclease subunit S [Empedobacter falsenii]
MSKLDELLKGIDVEWKTLGEVCEIIRGVRVTKKDLIENGKYPVVSGGTGYMGFVNEYNREENSITIAQYGTAGFVKWQNEKFWANDVAFTIYPINEDILLKRFLYYFLINKQNYLYEISNKIAVPFSISKEKILQIKIPIAPIEIQQEIVRVLDELTSLTNQLTTELETERQSRKKQFEFFREQLFRFEEGNIEFKTLGDITKLITKGTTPKIFSSNGINFIKIESFNNNKIIPNKFMFISKEIHEKELKRSILKSEDILFAIAGATIGKCAIVSEDILPANTNQALAIIRLNENINVKYIFNFLQSLEMKKYIEKFNKTSAQPNLNLKQISDFKIPIPSLEEQERIVKLLDQFDATHTAIEEEITKEIKLRTQQYEYYREKLLSFPQN